MKTALYRHFDAAGQLLYVGISADPCHRTATHGKKAGWRSSIARISVEWFPERWIALAAEADAIFVERPLHNRARPRVQPSFGSRRGYSYAVQHVESGFLDGWYFPLSMALEQLRWTRSEMPGHEISLLVLGPDAAFYPIADQAWLNSERMDQLIAASSRPSKQVAPGFSA